MAITHLSLVNQALANAAALLAMWGARDTRTSQARIERRALAAAALQQMAQGYRFYVREIAEQYQLKGLAQLDSAAALAAALTAAGRAPGEAQELQQLEADTHSWLAALLAAARQQTASPVPAPEVKAFAAALQSEEAAPELISLVEEPAEPNVNLPLWLQAFRQLVLRQRATSAEY